MKLLIDGPLVLIAESEPGTTEQDIEDSKEAWKETCAVLTKFGVVHTFTHDPEGFLFTVRAQKVSLNDMDMNELLFDGLWALDLDFRYAGLGGKGCETSFTVSQRD